MQMNRSQRKTFDRFHLPKERIATSARVAFFLVTGGKQERKLMYYTRTITKDNWKKNEDICKEIEHNYIQYIHIYNWIAVENERSATLLWYACDLVNKFYTWSTRKYTMRRGKTSNSAECISVLMSNIQAWNVLLTSKNPPEKENIEWSSLGNSLYR